MDELADMAQKGANLYSAAAELAAAERRLGRSREDAWQIMVGPENAGTGVEAVFDMVWPENS